MKKRTKNVHFLEPPRRLLFFSVFLFFLYILEKLYIFLQKELREPTTWPEFPSFLWMSCPWENKYPYFQ